MILYLGIRESPILGILLSLCTFTLGNLICLLQLTQSFSSLIHKFLFPILSNFLSVLGISNVQCSLYISYCCPSLSTFISEKSNSHFPYILLKRQKRSLISFLSPWQKPRSFFNWTVTSYIHVVTNSFWFYHFSSQASLFLSICETTDLFQAFIHSLLGYIIILHVFDLSSLILLSTSLPKWDFRNQSVPKQQK